MKPADRNKMLKARAMEKEMSRSRSVVGRLSDNVDLKRDVEQRLAEIPEDTRGITGRVFGDPIPNDPRCPWRPRVAA